MTDVNIATHLLVDAYQDNYDSALLISGDSDLVPPVKSINSLFPNKRVFIGFPPKRYNNSLSLVSKGHFVIGRKKFIENQLPLEIKKPDGYILRKPKEW